MHFRSSVSTKYMYGRDAGFLTRFVYKQLPISLSTNVHHIYSLYSRTTDDVSIGYTID